MIKEINSEQFVAWSRANNVSFADTTLENREPRCEDLRRDRNGDIIQFGGFLKKDEPYLFPWEIDADGNPVRYYPSIKE